MADNRFNKFVPSSTTSGEPKPNRFAQFLSPLGGAPGDASYRPTEQDLERANMDPSFAGVPTGASGPEGFTPPVQKPEVFLGPKRDDNFLESTGKAIARPVIGGLYNAGVETARTTTAVKDALMGTNDAQYIDKAFPRHVNPDAGIVENVVQTGVEYLPGMLVGFKGADKALKFVAPEMNRLGAMAFKAMGADIGGSMISANPNDKTLITGDNSLSQEMLGVSLPAMQTEEGSELFSKKLNLAVDNLIAGGAVSGALGLIGAAVKNIAPGPQLKNVMTMGSKSKQEDLAVRTLLDSLGAADSPEKIQQVINEVLNSKETLAELSKYESQLDDIASRHPTLNVFIKKWKEAAQKATNPLERQAINSNVATLNNAINTHGGERVRAARDMPFADLQQATGQMRERLATPEEVAGTAEGVYTQAQKDILGPDRATLEGLTAQKEGLSQLVDSAMKTDPLFGSLVGKVVNIRTGDAVKESAQTLTERILRTGSLLLNKKNKAYDKIGEGVIGDLSHVGKVLDEIDAYDPTLLGGNIRKRIEATGGDIKLLEEIASGQVSDKIRKLGIDQQVDAIKQIKKLKNALSVDQLNILDERVSGLVDRIEKLRKQKKGTASQKGELATLTEQLKNIRNAREIYVKEVLPWREHPILDEMLSIHNDFERVSDIEVPGKARKALVGGIDEMVQPKGLSTPEVMVDDPLKRDLASTVERTQENLGIRGSMGEPLKEQMRQYKLLDMAQKISQEVNTKKVLTNEDILKYTKEFENLAPLLSPEDQMNVETFLTTIRDQGVFDPKELDKLIEQTQVKVLANEDAVYKGVLEGFFDNTGELKGNSFESFKQMLNQPGNENRLQKIVDLARNSGDPSVMRGIKGTIAKYFDEVVVGAKETPSGVRIPSLDKLTQYMDESSSIANYVKIVYGDEFYREFGKLVEGARNELATVGRTQDGILDTQSVQAQGTQGINSIITWVFGVLNPTAARLRTVTSTYLRNNNVTPQMKNIMDEVLANPDEFVRIARRIKAGEARKKLAPDVKRIIKRAMLRGGMYGNTGEEEQPIDEQMNEVFGSSKEGVGKRSEAPFSTK